MLLKNKTKTVEYQHSQCTPLKIGIVFIKYPYIGKQARKFEEVISEDDSDDELDEEIGSILLIPLKESEEETEQKKVEIQFRPRRLGDSGNILDFTPLHTDISQTTPNITADL